MNKPWILLTLSFIVNLASFPPAEADVKTGNSVTIAADQTIEDDLYIFADTITVEGTIQGDLVAAGREIVISGIVEGDIMAAAQRLVISGRAEDDVRIAGQTLDLQGSGHVGDDLLAAGFSLSCAAGSNIDGEVQFAGYQATFAGDIGQDLDCAVANCLLSGTVGQNVHVVADGSGQPLPAYFPNTGDASVPAGVTVTESAMVRGDITYVAGREAHIDPAAQIAGRVNYRPIVIHRSGDKTQPSKLAAAMVSLKYFAALFSIGVLLVAAFPAWTQTITGNIQRQPLASLGWGLATFAVVLVVAALLLFGTIMVAVLLGLVSLESLILSWLALGTVGTAGLLTTYGIVAVWISKVVVSLWAGGRIAKLKQRNLGTSLLALTLGLLIFVGLSSIPWLGGIFSVLVSLCGTGAVTLWAFPGLLPDHKSNSSPPVKPLL